MSYQTLCEKKMKTFLNDYYTIPDYQRDYAWEYDQLDDFISDLDSIRTDGYDTHGFGQLLFTMIILLIQNILWMDSKGASLALFF